MTVPALYQNPTTADEMAVWSFSHQAHHRDIARVVFDVYGVRLDEFVLDPFDPQEEEGWLVTHQIMHSQMDQILGIPGFVLSNVDWNDPDQLKMWLSRHGNEHYIAGTILNIG
jgi:hypothetical protein